MATDADSRALRAVDEDRGVPPDERPEATLDVLVAGVPRLVLRRNRVDVVGRRQRRHAHLHRARLLEQAQHDIARTVPAGLADQGRQGVDPLLGLVGVDVGQVGGNAVEDRAGLLGTEHEMGPLCE